MQLEKIAPGENPPYDINVVIEIPGGAAGGAPVKYEIDKHSGALFVDRIVNVPMVYPNNYGFVPNTLHDDGEPVDVMVRTEVTLAAGSVIRCRLIGVLHMEHDGGQDEKILAVPASKLTKMYDGVHDIGDIQAIQVERVKHFFTHYKDLEPGKWAKISHVGGYEDAKKVVLDSIEMAANAK